MIERRGGERWGVCVWRGGQSHNNTTFTTTHVTQWGSLCYKMWDGSMQHSHPLSLSLSLLPISPPFVARLDPGEDEETQLSGHKHGRHCWPVDNNSASEISALLHKQVRRSLYAQEFFSPITSEVNELLIKSCRKMVSVSAAVIWKNWVGVK